MPNMKEIAHLAGVSLGTVSNVLNGSPTVRESMRRKVMEAVEATGYQPSQLARGLRRDKSDMIGMMIPDITNPFFPAVVRGAQDVAFRQGFQLILCNTDNDSEMEAAHLRSLRTYLPSGLIMIPCSLSNLTAQTEGYAKAGTAVVCVDRLPKDWSGDSVTADNERGGYLAAEHLLRAGHRSVAMINGPRQFANVQDRMKGFRRALRESGVEVPPEYVQETAFDQSSGYRKTQMLMKLQPRPTAIFAGGDVIAFGVLRALDEAGLRCPGDVSVVGFDDLDLSENTSPPLTSVSQPGYQMGSTAARLLIERLGGKSGAAEHVLLATSVRMRESVGPPPAKGAAHGERSAATREDGVGVEGGGDAIFER